MNSKSKKSRSYLLGLKCLGNCSTAWMKTEKKNPKKPKQPTKNPNSEEAPQEAIEMSDCEKNTYMHIMANTCVHINSFYGSSCL